MWRVVNFNLQLLRFRTDPDPRNSGLDSLKPEQVKLKTMSPDPNSSAPPPTSAPPNPKPANLFEGLLGLGSGTLQLLCC